MSLLIDFERVNQKNIIIIINYCKVLVRFATKYIVTGL